MWNSNLCRPGSEVRALARLATEQLARRLQRFDSIEDDLGDGYERRAEEQPPYAPQPAEEQQRDEEPRGVDAREPALQPGHESEPDQARKQERRGRHRERVERRPGLQEGRHPPPK